MTDRDQFGDFAGPAQPPAQSIGGWQPIETAPKDGRRILAYEDGNYYAAEWVPEMPGAGYWKSHCGQYVTISPEPTHWMPIPPPPAKHGGDR